MDTKKRGRNEARLNGNGAGTGFNKRQETETGIGGKMKPCTKFFSMAGCPFGEGCHFLHYVPGGYNSGARLTKPGTTVPQVSRNFIGQQTLTNGANPLALKSKLCNRFNTAEGCKFGDMCNFAHGEWELNKPIVPSHDDPRAVVHAPIRIGTGMGQMNMMGVSGRTEPPPPVRPTATFGASATAKISVDASLAGPIIGKAGVNSKQICRQTGCKLSIKDHESDPNLKNIELEGTFEQIQQATAMVRELIMNIGSMASVSAKPHGAPAKPHGASSAEPRTNFKTKLCENFMKGSCTFGDKCHFAHGANQLRKIGI